MAAVQSAAAELSVAACAAQHPGDRSEQQDRVAILRSSISPRCVLALLADGLGGKSGGAMAAAQVVMVARRLFEDFRPGESAHQFFDTLVDEVNTVISLTGMTANLEPHSTLVAVLVQSGRADWCHVGDSRVYHFRGARLLHRTTDHTFAQRLLDSGLYSAERARLHPSAGRLTRALGSRRRPDATHGGTEQAAAGDRFLLCSDGLWAYYSDEELGLALDSMPTRAAAETLIAGARGRAQGRGDNCSLVLLNLRPGEAVSTAAAGCAAVI